MYVVCHYLLLKGNQHVWTFDQSTVNYQISKSGKWAQGFDGVEWLLALFRWMLFDTPTPAYLDQDITVITAENTVPEEGKHRTRTYSYLKRSGWKFDKAEV